MKIDYVVQRDFQLGSLLDALFDASPKRVVFVSAFVGLQTVMRLKVQVSRLKVAGSDIRLVVGIDLGGTSREVLKELLSWQIDVRVVKHRIPGHTFHPKLYLFEWEDKAELIVGSNNVTEGGFFGNYEVASRTQYQFPGDLSNFKAILGKLSRFVNPTGSTAYGLTEAFYAELVARNELPTEEEARKGRDIGRRVQAAGRAGRWAQATAVRP